MDQILEKIKKIDWKYLVSRKEAVLIRSYTGICYQFFKETTDIDWKATAELRPGGKVLYSATELGNLRNIFINGGVELFKEFARRLHTYMDAFDLVSTEIEEKRYASADWKELENDLEKYNGAALRAATFLLPMPVADGVISEMIVKSLPETSEDEKQSILLDLTYPQKENSHTEEERSFYNLAIAKQNGSSEYGKLLEKHLKDFKWIGARGYWWNLAWTEKDIEERLNNLFIQNKDPKEELEHLNGVRKERQEAFKKVIEKIGMGKNKEFMSLVEIAKEYAFLRTYRTDIVYGSGYKARELFEEIAKRVNLNINNIPYLTFYEFAETAKNQKLAISNEEVEQRKKFFGSILLDGKYLVLSGKGWEEKLKDVYKTDDSIVKEIRGNIAFPGKASGAVKIVLAGQDISKVQRGDILVAVMTFPNFIPAMEKASAFVTDEGGILCHAAIVAREMKKPCVIATKIATQTLKDGDIIEVDADKGVVRIL